MTSLRQHDVVIHPTKHPTATPTVSPINDRCNCTVCGTMHQLTESLPGCSAQTVHIALSFHLKYGQRVVRRHFSCKKPGVNYIRALAHISSITPPPMVSHRGRPAHGARNSTVTANPGTERHASMTFDQCHKNNFPYKKNRARQLKQKHWFLLDLCQTRPG